jgi:hypothetical protein
MMQRAERIVFLGVGALFHPIAFKLSVWIVAILANITALQRLRHSAKQENRVSDHTPAVDEGEE